MSANNYIRISKDGEWFVVSDKDSDTGKGFEIGRAKGFKGARMIANEYLSGHIVEYGLHIDEDCYDD